VDPSGHCKGQQRGKVIRLSLNALVHWAALSTDDYATGNRVEEEVTPHHPTETTRADMELSGTMPSHIEHYCPVSLSSPNVAPYAAAPRLSSRSRGR
jgi:hypothetical protein